MALFTIDLLGTPRVTCADRPLDLRVRKELALLAYLAVEAGHPHRRDHLLALLWPDSPEDTARNNLRVVLAGLRRALGDAADATLQADRQQVQFLLRGDTAVDVLAFRGLLDAVRTHPHAALESCESCVAHLAEAAERYGGEFLSGFSLSDSVQFEEWATVQRERLHQQQLEALETLTSIAERRGDHVAQCGYARRQLALEPWHETAHAQLMRGLWASGQRGAALEQFEICRRILADELGLEPSPELNALAEQIRSAAKPPLRAPTPPPAPAAYWNDAPTVWRLYGRTGAAATLDGWLAAGVRVSVVLGLGGVGKTALAAAVARAASARFDAVVWRSLVNMPPLDETLRAILDALGDSPLPHASLDKQLDLLLQALRQRRCLLVFDNMESLLEAGRPGVYRPGYAPYGQVLQYLGERDHRSSLLVTSRELPSGLDRLDAATPALRLLHLGGLDTDAGREMLAAHGLSATAADARTLVARYSGNPLALKLVAQTIGELFGGDVGAFLAGETLFPDDIAAVLDQQWARLSALERDLLLWLAIEREPLTAAALRANLVPAPQPQALLVALQALRRRSLVEPTAAVDGQPGTAFGLQNVILEYATTRLVDVMCDEIVAGSTQRLQSHALLKAQSKEYVRQSQERLILRPVAERLRAQRGEQRVAEHIRTLLNTLREGPVRAPGYAGGNLLNLLRQLGVTLAGYDFSGLSVWQADLRGVSAPESNFAGCDLTGSAFTDTFNQGDIVAFSPDGRWLVGGAVWHAIQVWQVADHQLYRILPGHTSFVCTVAFRPGSSLLVSGGADGVVAVWDVELGQASHLLAEHTGWVRTVGFSPDGTLLASAGDDRVIRLWDAHTWRVRQILHGHDDIIHAVAFSPDGRLLASGGGGAIRVWDVAAGRVLATLPGHSGSVQSVAFHPSGTLLASGGEDQTVRVWDVAGACPRTILRGHVGHVHAVAFSGDGDLLASGGVDRSVRIWDFRSGATRHILVGHSGVVYALAFSPDGAVLASGSWDRTIREWEPHTGRAVHMFYGYTNGANAARFSPDGSLLASSHGDRNVRVWSITPHHTHISRTLAHPEEAFTLAFNPAGTLLATGCNDHLVRLWDVRTGQLLRTLHGHGWLVWSVAFSPEGSLLASASADHTVRIWQVETGRLLHTLHGHEHGVWSVAFSPDGSLLASGSIDGTVRLWDPGSGALRRTLRGHGRAIESVAFSPDGRLLASGSADQSVRLWELESGDLVRTLHGHINGIWCVVFSPDGSLLASSSEDQTVRLWDVASGRTIRILDGHTHEVFSVAFSPDGQKLVSSSRDETIQLWGVPTGKRLDIVSVAKPYAGMVITGATGLTAAQRASLVALGAVDGGRDAGP